MVNKEISVFNPIKLAEGLYIGKHLEKSKPILFDDYKKDKVRSKVKIIGMAGEKTKNSD